MIKLIVPEYCQSCADFEPQVTHGPEQLDTGYGDIVLCGDTYVECKHRHRCKTIYEYLKNEKDKK